MATDFVKVYRKFFLGSMRDAPPWARLTFLAMISMADENGIVYAAPMGIAGYGAIPTENIDDALIILQSPDPNSSTQEEDGIRIVLESPNCWRIVNYLKYYEMNRASERREYLRLAKQKERSKKQGLSTGVNNGQHVNRKGKERKGKETPDVSTSLMAEQTRTASGMIIGPAPAEVRG